MRQLRWLVVLLAAAAVFGLGGALALSLKGDGQFQHEAEWVQALLQVGLIAVIGIVTSGMLEHFKDTLQQRRDNGRLRFDALSDLSRAYMDVKLVRRKVQATKDFTATQTDRLNEIQVQIELHKRNSSRLFQHGDELGGYLYTMEHYLNVVANKACSEERKAFRSSRSFKVFSEAYGKAALLMQDEITGPHAPRSTGSSGVFVAYMAVATVLVGIPWFALPNDRFQMYTSMRPTLAGITPILSLLVLAVLFSYRGAFARALLPPDFGARPKEAVILALLPLIFAILAAACVFGYHVTMDRSLAVARTDQYLDVLAHETWADTATGVQRLPTTAADSIAARKAARRAISRGYPSMDAALLDKSPAAVAVHRGALTFLYLGMFLFAEAALVIMALREYLQKQLASSAPPPSEPPSRARSAAAASPPPP